MFQQNAGVYEITDLANYVSNASNKKQKYMGVSRLFPYPNTFT